MHAFLWSLALVQLLGASVTQACSGDECMQPFALPFGFTVLYEKETVARLIVNVTTWCRLGYLDLVILTRRAPIQPEPGCVPVAADPTAT
jgi:hypothetical protein